MNPTQIAAEAAQEIKRFIEENEYANAVDFESIIQAAIEKGIQAWLCDKGWQRKTFEPIIKKATLLRDREDTKRRAFHKAGCPKLPSNPNLTEIAQWLRDSAIWQQLQEYGREMDAREWAATCLNSAADSIAAMKEQG